MAAILTRAQAQRRREDEISQRARTSRPRGASLHDIVSREAVPGDPSTRRLGYVERVLEHSSCVLVRWEDDREPWCDWTYPVAPRWRVNDPGDVLSVRIRRWCRMSDSERALVTAAVRELDATDLDIEHALRRGALTVGRQREEAAQR